MDNAIVYSSSEAGWPEGFSSPPSILLVDDEAKILTSMRRLLHPLGYHIIIAESGEKALEILSQETVDLVISDMRMPNMDGAQFLSQVRQHWPYSLRILLTGYADIASTVMAINKAEIYRYIAKPWDDDEMILTVQRALEQKGLEKERKRLQKLVHEKNDELELLNSSLEKKVQERTEELAQAHKELTQTHEELTQSHNRLKQNFLTSIKIFSNLIEMRAGPFFTGNSRQIADLSRKIAKHLELSKVVIQDVMLAGLLHDIGKIGFPDTLLTKPLSQFSGEELELLKKHPCKGATALIALEELQGASLLIRHQHEHYDGTGFPDGLSGTAIPEGAGILALASDYYAAQLGLRSTQKLTAEEASLWIIKGKGTLYVPHIVDAFIEVTKPAATQSSSSTMMFKERCLSSQALKEGMISHRDLITPDGLFLIAAGHVLDEALIQKIQTYEKSEKIILSIWIRYL